MFGLLPLFALAAALVVLGGVTAMVHAGLKPLSKGYAWALANGRPTDPADLGTTGAEITLGLSDGDQTTAWDIAGFDPDGPCVVFVHGHGATRYAAFVMAEPLLPAVSRLIAFDLPGHGDSTATRCTLGLREPDETARVVEQIDDGQTPIVLFGSSMGAQTALAAAAKLHEHPRLSGVILLGVYRRFAEPLPGHLRRMGVPRWPFAPLGLFAYRLRLGRGIGFDRAADARHTRCPVYLVHGEHDDLCPLASAEAIRDAVSTAGNETELVVFPDGGHTTLHRTHPDLYGDTLRRFVGRIATTSRPASLTTAC